jgi:hypothetical protein
VKRANDMQYNNEDDSFWSWTNAQQGSVVNVHEFGHVLGLGHQAGFDVMNALTPEPLAGQSWQNAEPFPDDANGVRGYYGVTAPEQNIFASAQKYVNGVVQSTDQWQPKPVCPGQNIAVVVSVVNNGNTDLSNYGFRLFINDSPHGYTGGLDMFNGTATSLRGSYFTQTLSVNVPFVSPGTYWILWSVDINHQYSEWNEGDNATHSAMALTVKSGC